MHVDNSESRHSDRPAYPAEGVRLLAEMCAVAGVEEISAADGAWSVRLRLDHAGFNSSGEIQPANSAPDPSGPYQFTSQWVGVFHRSSDIGVPAYVEEGQDLAEGDIVGVVAAMQLQHEVRVDRSGRLLRFLVLDGTALEFGQPLLEIG